MNENSKRFVAQYAKSMDITLTDAEDRIVEIAASRINALRRYAKRVKGGEVHPPSLAKRKAAPKKAKAPKKDRAPKKAKAPKVTKAKVESAEQVQASVPGDAG